MLKPYRVKGAEAIKSKIKKRAASQAAQRPESDVSERRLHDYVKVFARKFYRMLGIERRQFFLSVFLQLTPLQFGKSVTTANQPIPHYSKIPAFNYNVKGAHFKFICRI